MKFTIGTEQVFAHSAYFKQLYLNAGLGIGEVPLTQIKAMVDECRDRLQVSDIVCKYERDLSKVGYALFEGEKRGIATVSVHSPDLSDRKKVDAAAIREVLE